MARDLFETEPAFRRSMIAFDDRFRREEGTSLLDAIYSPTAASAIDETGFTQPALFAIECALARVWASWGVGPDMVLGHSVGAFAAACVAGVFDEDDGLRLVSARARLMQALPRSGSMRVVFADRHASAPPSPPTPIAYPWLRRTNLPTPSSPVKQRRSDDLAASSSRPVSTPSR